MDALMNFGQGIFGGIWPAVWTLLKIVLIVAPLMLAVAYLTYFERKVIGYMQVRIGPNRVGPLGLIQPIADGLKFFLKEDYTSNHVDKWMFTAAPALLADFYPPEKRNRVFTVFYVATPVGSAIGFVLGLVIFLVFAKLLTLLLPLGPLERLFL